MWTTEYELTINGEPVEFGVMAKEFNPHLAVDGARYPKQYDSPFAIGALRPDANPVTVSLYLKDNDGIGTTERLRITAYREPSDKMGIPKSRLRVRIDDSAGVEPRHSWESLYAKLQQGWIDKQLATSSAHDGQQVEAQTIRVRMNRNDVYHHLSALCQNDNLFGIANYRDKWREEDWERITICANQFLRPRGSLGDDRDRADNIPPSARGAIIGTVRLLPTDDNTTIMFIGKDVIWREPIPVGGAELFAKFIARVCPL